MCAASDDDWLRRRTMSATIPHPASPMRAPHQCRRSFEVQPRVHEPCVCEALNCERTCRAEAGSASKSMRTFFARRGACAAPRGREVLLWVGTRLL